MTDTFAVLDEQYVARIGLILAQALVELCVGFGNIFALHPAKPVRDAPHVRVDRTNRCSERKHEHARSCFDADTRLGRQPRDRLRTVECCQKIERVAAAPLVGSAQRRLDAFRFVLR